MKYQNKRPESPKGKVFNAFVSGGEKAARDEARDWEITDGKLARWFVEWADDAPTKRATVEPRVKLKRKGETFVPEKGDRVVLTYDDDIPGTVIAPGTLVSSIKFDNRVERFIRNAELQPTRR